MAHTALGRLVGDESRFLDDHWGQAPAHITGVSEDAFADLLSRADVDRLLGELPFCADLVRISRAGDLLAADVYTDRVQVASHVEHRLVNPTKVRRQLDEGATVVLSAMDRCWPPLGRLCRTLASELMHPVDAYVFITSAGAPGLQTHIDHESTFLLQVHGEKRWTLYERLTEHPERTTPVGEHEVGPPATFLDLRAGDVLYIPPGLPHRGQSSAGQTSMHVNLSVRLLTWRHVLGQVLADILADDSLLDTLPPGQRCDPERLATMFNERGEWMHRRLVEVQADTILKIVRRTAAPETAR